MAKDILVNAQSGDLLLQSTEQNTTFFDVVWGKLFDTDDGEYMNIVVPTKYINNTTYTDGVYECSVKALYYPVNSSFQARLVVKNVVGGEYDNITKYNSSAPTPTGCVYYPKFSGKPSEISACQLPYVNADGLYKVVFKKYSNSNFTRCVIYPINDLDFQVGASDNQSAQLLVRCAPGKSYRYPTTGLDLTKYINSVVEHTDMSEKIVDVFDSDSKTITDAEFESASGELKVAFIGSSEANDGNLTDPTLLDMDLFKLADDDWVRSACKTAQSIVADNSGYISDLKEFAEFLGLYDVGKEAELDSITVSDINYPSYIDEKGNVVQNSKFPYGFSANMELSAGTLYAICYKPDFIITSGYSVIDSKKIAVYSRLPRFVIKDKSGNIVYIDQPFTTYNKQDIESDKNYRECFIPLTDLTVTMLSSDSTFANPESGGIFPVADKSGNYASILGLAVNQTTGRLSAVTSIDSIIEDVKIDGTTNQILIIKQNI